MGFIYSFIFFKLLVKIEIGHFIIKILTVYIYAPWIKKKKKVTAKENDQN
jgi:hypothetical protein